MPGGHTMSGSCLRGSWNRPCVMAAASANLVAVPHHQMHCNRTSAWPLPLPPPPAGSPAPVLPGWLPDRPLCTALAFVDMVKRWVVMSSLEWA